MIGIERVKEIVITAQYSPRAIDKSIYQIEIISQKDIKNRAANIIVDILNYNLNILTIPNGKTEN